MAVRTSAILAFAWMATRLLPRATAATRHLVWHLALIAVLTAPVVAPFAPAFDVPQLPWARQGPSIARVLDSTQAFVRRVAIAGGFDETDLADAVSSGASGEVAAILENGSTLGSPSSLGTSGTVKVLWIAGSAAVGLWFLIGWIATTLTAHVAPPAPAEWQVELAGLCRRLRIASPVRLRILRGNTSPLAMGLWRSTVLLPEAAKAWDDECRQAVLLHEVAHVRRGDCRTHAIAQAACVVYWFNPLVWLAFRHLRVERERACDDEVLRTGARPSAYAAHLLDIAQHLRAPLLPALAMARPTELEGRLLAVLAPNQARVPAPGSRTAISVTLALATFAALGASPIGSSLRPAQKPAADAPTRSVHLPAGDGPTPRDSFEARRARAQASETLASSPNPQDRERAVMDLAASGQTAALGALQAALDDPDQDVREKAALALGLMSDAEVIPVLVRALKDRNAQVREKAAIGLALRRDARSSDALLAAIEDPDPQVREKVAIALGTSGDPRASAALERALDDPDSQVREKADAGLLLLRSGGTDQESGERIRAGVRGLLGALAALAR